MSGNDRVNLEHLSVEIEEGAVGADTVYTFRGALNEFFHYKLVPVATQERVRFNLREIRTLNSCGVREWVYFVRQFSGKSRLVFEEVAVPFVDQVNTVPQMLGSGTVRSFLAPFYCSHCDEELSELLVCEEHRALLLKRQAPPLAHATCGLPLEFDALEDCYFHQMERFFG